MILIADDDPDFTEILSIKLKRAGFEVVTGATNGEEAIQKAKELKPDLIFLDVQMPKMNGMEALKKLKEEPETAKLKVVFMTSYGDPSKEAVWLDEKFARNLGAVDYMRKTDDLEKIVNDTKNILLTNRSTLV